MGNPWSHQSKERSTQDTKTKQVLPTKPGRQPSTRYLGDDITIEKRAKDNTWKENMIIWIKCFEPKYAREMFSSQMVLVPRY